jgi:hypothetical protein
MDLFSNPLRNQLHHLHHIWQKTGYKRPHFCNNMPLLRNNMPLSMRLCRGSRFKAEGLEEDFDKTGDAVVDDV